MALTANQKKYDNFAKVVKGKVDNHLAFLDKVKKANDRVYTLSKELNQSYLKERMKVFCENVNRELKYRFETFPENLDVVVKDLKELKSKNAYFETAMGNFPHDYILEELISLKGDASTPLQGNYLTPLSLGYSEIDAYGLEDYPEFMDIINKCGMVYKHAQTSPFSYTRLNNKVLDFYKLLENFVITYINKETQERKAKSSKYASYLDTPKPKKHNLTMSEFEGSLKDKYQLNARRTTVRKARKTQHKKVSKVNRMVGATINRNFRKML